MVDDEFGDMSHKEKSFADKVMFWKKDDAAATPQQTAALDGSNTPLDAAAEKERVAKLTGDKPITIQREAKSKIKLPGLWDLSPSPTGRDRPRSGQGGEVTIRLGA